MGLMHKIYITGSVVIAVVAAMLSDAWAAVSATAIYQQAKLQNYRYLKSLLSSSQFIDVQDENGNTAYCLALINKDWQAQHLLRAFGANKNHKCVRKLKAHNASLRQNSQRVRAVASSPNYLAWGVGAAVVGGGVALAASHSGGDHSLAQNNEERKSDDGAGETVTPVLPENPDDNSYNPKDDEDVYKTDGDDDKPVNGGSSSLTVLSEAFFKTSEYEKSNFLEGIHAAAAYSYIYQKDENGQLVGHQAGSDELLENVKVGVLDTGVYSNKELEGKIVSGYDINRYNHLGNIKGLTKDGVHHYVVEYEGLFYYLPVKVMDWVSVSPSDINYKKLTLSELNELLAERGISLDEFTVINGGNGRAPGAAEYDFDPDIYTSWWHIISQVHHGTHVAGIIAGDKNDEGSHGVAFNNAEIVAASWDLEQNIYSTVAKMVDNGVKVFNNSWGQQIVNQGSDTAAVANKLFSTTKGGDILKSYAYAATHKAVWIQAVGNDSNREVGLAYDAEIHAGIGNLDVSKYGYSGAKRYEVPFLAVTALDYDTRDGTAVSGKISNYANNCGSASGYCLAAPGSDVYSSAALPEGGIYMSGTSMATPVVSGSIALLKGYYPWLTAQNVAYILLETANKDGVYSNSEIYGQGALDLEAAVTTPIDGLYLAQGENLSSLQSVQGTKLALSPVFQGVLGEALPTKITAFDALQRPFDYQTSNMVVTTHSGNASFRQQVSQMGLGGQRREVKDVKNGFQFSSSESLGRDGAAHLSEAEVVYEGDGNRTRLYYSENSKYGKGTEVLRPSGNPYMAMREAYGVENTLKLSEASRFHITVQTGENGMYERDYEQDKHSFDERSYGISGRYSYGLTDYLELSVLGGMLYEDEAVLGLNGSGGFGLTSGATYYMGLQAALNLTPNVRVMAAYYRGYTQGSEASMLSLSDIETESFSLAGEYQITPQQKVGLSLSSPLSVVKGQASMLYATGRDNYSDRVYTERLTSSLKPAAKEYDTGVYYEGRPSEVLSLMGKVQARFNADGEKGVTDYMGIVGAHYAF